MLNFNLLHLSRTAMVQNIELRMLSFNYNLYMAIYSFSFLCEIIRVQANTFPTPFFYEKTFGKFINDQISNEKTFQKLIRILWGHAIIQTVKILVPQILDNLLPPKYPCKNQRSYNCCIAFYNKFWCINI